MTRTRCLSFAALACAALAAAAPGQIVVGIDEGGLSQVSLFAELMTPPDTFIAYPGFSGGVRVAAGDVNGDGVADIVTGAGPGGGPHVKVFDAASREPIRSFFAYDANFTGGVYVAAGDVNGDGFDDIITGTGSGATAHVRAFSGQTGGELHSFFAYGAGFTGGVRVAAGDVNGDGFDDIITGTGAGAPGGHIKVFDGSSGTEIRSFLSFESAFTGGVFVAAGDLDGDGAAEIIVGPDAPHTPVVRVFDGMTLQMRSIPLNIPQSNDGVRVGTHFLQGPAGPGIIAILIGLLIDHSFPGVVLLDPQTGQPLQSQLLGSPEYFQRQVFVAGSLPPLPPTCRADFNGDGNRDPDDLADFITCFFTLEPACRRADFNRDGNRDPDDLADFITVFFSLPC